MNDRFCSKHTKYVEGCRTCAVDGKEREMKAYAIGFNDQVEIRISESPPKEETSEVTRKVKVTPKPRGWDPYWDGAWRSGPKSFKIKTTIHLGGRVVNVVTARSFRTRTGLPAPKHGVMVEFPYNLVEKFRKGHEDGD